jgi:glycosyltransferase involved in cell wall biosynthesis
MKTLVSLNAAMFRIPFYNQLVLEHGVRVVILMTEDCKRPEHLRPEIETIRTRRIFGTIWPSQRVTFPDVGSIVCIFDIRVIPWLLLTGLLRRTALWGIGKGNRKLINLLRRRIILLSAGQISYMPRGLIEPYDDGENRRISRYIVNSIFVNNPVQLWAPSFKLAFIGTIDRRKRLDVALHALRHLQDMGMGWTLDVIGDGPDLNRCRVIAKKLRVDHLISWHGRIWDEDQKRKILQDTFAVVLPGQAGLSVLESFSYGLPVLSWIGAVSGGEIDMIVNGVTGYTEPQLCPLMMANRLAAMSASPDAVRLISDRCLATFRGTASGQHMLNRFVDCLAELGSSSAHANRS